MAGRDALSKSPILTLIGADDDYTPAVLIDELSPAINENGGNSRIIMKIVITHLIPWTLLCMCQML